MSLRIVNPFSEPYVEWSQKDATQEERLAFYREHGFFGGGYVNDRVKAVVNNHYEAAVYQVKNGATGIENHIDEHLKNDENFADWRRRMPSAIPKPLWNYQVRHQPGLTYPEVSEIINQIGVCLPDGQYVYHGGLLSKNGNEFITTRPLSTSLCPQIGVRLGDKHSNAFKYKRLELALLKVKDSNTKTYIFKNKNTDKGHEKEIVFAAGARIYLRGSHLVTLRFPTTSPTGGVAHVPGYVVVGEIS